MTQSALHVGVYWCSRVLGRQAYGNANIIYAVQYFQKRI